MDSDEVSISVGATSWSRCVKSSAGALSHKCDKVKLVHGPMDSETWLEFYLTQIPGRLRSISLRRRPTKLSHELLGNTSSDVLTKIAGLK
jgi:hypothetical protein